MEKVLQPRAQADRNSYWLGAPVMFVLSDMRQLKFKLLFMIIHR